MGGTGLSAGGASVAGAGATGSPSGGATAAGGMDASGVAGTSSGGASGTGGVTGAGGTTGDGGATGSGGAAGDGGPATSDDAGCGFTGCACPPECQCDNNGGHSYAFCATLVTWDSASAACASVGARLVRVDDASENEWLVARAPTAGVTTTADAMWLGASDAAMEGAWRWEDGEQFWDDTVNAGAGAPVGSLYSNWHGPTPPFAAAEPNNTGGFLGSPGEDCAMMRSDGTWNDGSCSSTAGYVCEAY